MMFSRRSQRATWVGIACALWILGCHTAPEEITYLGKPSEPYYRNQATTVSFPTVSSCTPNEIQFSLEPHTVRDTSHVELRPITLAEAIHTALHNAEIIRTNGTFLSPGNPILSNPDRVASTYDPAIQETGVLFGGRGVEAALAAFDAQLTTRMVWGRNETVQNNPFFGGGLGGGGVLKQETAQFQSVLSKNFAYGGQFQLQHNVNYVGTNAPGTLFGSVYTGNLTAQYRHPLLAGSGVEYTRVAGPISQSFGGISGVSQGVLIARINNDITIAQFEAALHDLIRDVEEAYWDLTLAYRNFNTASVARDAAEEIWEKENIRLEIGTGSGLEEARARNDLYAARAAVKNTRSQLFTFETRLRRLLGYMVNDGTVLMPVDEPITVEVIPDWYTSLTEALANRPQLRQQKWNIKSLELQLSAAKSLTQPRLDFVGAWQVNGFGDQLFDYKSLPAGAPERLHSFYGNLAAGKEQGWNLGFEFNWPIGFRLAYAQVRNYELRLAKARKVLSEQEKEIAQELAVAFQELSRAYAAARENWNRMQAAHQEVEVRIIQEDVGTENIDEKLRAIRRRADAEVAYFTSLMDYNKALANMEYRKGLILAYNNVHIKEGPWTESAYEFAERRADARAHARPGRLQYNSTPDLSSPVPVGSVQFATPEAAAHLLSEEQVIDESSPRGSMSVDPSEPMPSDDASDTPPDVPPAPPEDDDPFLEALRQPIFR